MKVVHYEANLNNGRVITEASAVGSELTWDTPRWTAAPHLIEKNAVTLEETAGGLLLHAEIATTLPASTEAMCFAEKNPIVIELSAKADSDILAYYYFRDWWTRPAFISSFEEVPDETGILFYRAEGQYHFLLALPGKVFRAHFEGRTGCENIRLVLSADCSGYVECRETAMLAVSDPNPYRCMEKGMEYAAKLYSIPLREQRTYPAVLQKLGWCSWDAFYKEVSESGVTAKAEEIRDKKIPFGWMIIDDGWQDYAGDRMLSYGYNSGKFPEGLAGAVRKVKEICGIDEIGVWHAFSGYWGGIDPDSTLVAEHPERFIRTHQGKVLPKPDAEEAYRFFADWYRYLKSQGIHFVKVDSQSSTRQHYRTNTPTGETSAALHAGLDRATGDFFEEGLINCMGMAMEDVLQRPSSGVTRNSDDFFPSKMESFKEHLLENAYNTIWHNVIYYGDWDMFWSSHPYAKSHALLRALSGGPVYVSDKVGESVKEVLMPLCYEDGTILRSKKGAVPTVDCLLTDPAKTGFLKLRNTCGDVRYLAVCSYSEETKTLPLKVSDFKDAEDGFLEDNVSYAVFDVFYGTGFVKTKEGEWDSKLEGNSCMFYQASAVKNGIAVFGRDDKYLSSHAVIDRTEDEKGCTVRIREMGPVRIYAEGTPECRVNGEPVPATPLGGEKGFYRIEMPVRPEEAQITIQIRN